MGTGIWWAQVEMGWRRSFRWAGRQLQKLLRFVPRKLRSDKEGSGRGYVWLRGRARMLGAGGDSALQIWKTLETAPAFIGWRCGDIDGCRARMGQGGDRASCGGESRDPCWNKVCREKGKAFECKEGWWGGDSIGFGEEER
jgi:hypothetical protein